MFTTDLQVFKILFLLSSLQWLKNVVQISATDRDIVQMVQISATDKDILQVVQISATDRDILQVVQISATDRDILRMVQISATYRDILLWKFTFCYALQILKIKT